MSSAAINELDYDSPGYEFLRLHRNMMNLYFKLVALDYQRDFCPVYKCPSINKYYFSCAQSNSFEQKYLFISISAWLIRDKCQMNFEMELENVSSSIGVIFEALKVLHDDMELDAKFHIRLEQGYGPEVIYALSCLADRALELAREHDPLLGTTPEIHFHNKQHDQTRSANSITIGQPIAGGTLTTRSLGKYFIEDSSLILDHQPREEDKPDEKINPQQQALIENAPTPEDWYQQVDKIADLLSAPIGLTHESGAGHQDWLESLHHVRESRRAFQAFLNRSKPVLAAIEDRVNRQIQVIATREKFLQTNLQQQLETFLRVWRNHSSQARLNKELMSAVNEKTDMFESYNSRLRLLAGDIEARIRELNDGSKLKELDLTIQRLDRQSDELDARIGLLMAAHSKTI